MGCSTSKLDDLPAVALCRDRCNFLEDALHHSYSLADAHVAYMNSLKTLGPSLHNFFNHNINPSDHSPSKPTPPDHSPSSSNSDSHIQFDTDSDDENKKEKDFESFNPNYPNHETLNDNFMSLYYTKNQPTQSVSYTYPNHNNYQSYDDSSGSKTPPPPAPSSSAWDFLNFFDTYEKYELPYTVIVNKEVKDKEEIHDVEGGKEINAKLAAQEKSTENNVVLDKKVNKERNDAVESKDQSGKPGVSDVMREVQVLFERASDSGNEILKMLDAGKFRYLHKNSVYQVSSKMLHVVTPSSSMEKNGSVYVGNEEDVVVNARNLSTTLKKLCMWEKKLNDEVKAEEKLRKIHARKCRQMESFDEKSGDTHKLDSVRSLVRTLSTKLKISIQVIDKISITINKLRDEELGPQINDLINRLLGMWKAMLECHRCQSQAVAEAKSLDVVASIGKLSDAHLEAAIKLKLELQSWNLSFSNWVHAQKGYVKSLNGWLLKCLLYEPEETPDGIAPFSPGRIGAPPVFVICYQWSQAMDRISEKEVIESMHGFLTSVNQLLEQHNVELQQRVTADKNMERRVKILEREGQKMQKLMQAREKKMVLVTGEENGVRLPGHQSGVTTSSLHSGLNQIFMSMERLAANFIQAYEDLHTHIEEGRLA